MVTNSSFDSEQSKKKSAGLETPLKFHLFRESHCGGFCSRLWLTALTPCQIKVWKYCIQDYFPEIFFKHLETHLSLREWRQKVKDTKCVSDLSVCWFSFYSSWVSHFILFLYIPPVITWLQCALCVSQHTQYSAVCQKTAAFKVKQGWKIWPNTMGRWWWDAGIYCRCIFLFQH